MSLCHILCGCNAEGGCFFFGEVIGDRQCFEGGQGADDAMDIVLFN
jgi:hypothetical protein